MIPMRRSNNQLRNGFCTGQRTLKRRLNDLRHEQNHVSNCTFANQMEKAIFEVEGMSCGHCSNAVKNLIEEVEGVKSTSVDLTSKIAKVEFDSNSTNAKTIIDNINSSNIYKASQK